MLLPWALSNPNKQAHADRRGCARLRRALAAAVARSGGRLGPLSEDCPICRQPLCLAPPAARDDYGEAEHAYGRARDGGGDADGSGGGRRRRADVDDVDDDGDDDDAPPLQAGLGLCS